MARLISVACVVALLLPIAEPQHGRFSGDTPVEAYEIRPGILIMPKYTGDGQLCQVVIQRDHYTKGIVDLDSTLSREVVSQIFDELAPPAERGPLTTNKALEGLSLYGGGGVTTYFDYEHVLLDISRPASSPGYVVALVTWKDRECQRGAGQQREAAPLPRLRSPGRGVSYVRCSPRPGPATKTTQGN